MGPERRAPQGSSASSRDPFVGRVLDGRYRIIERIARGGMASVHAATDLRLDRTVAIKIMHPGLGDDSDFAARFVGEARAAARLSHPNVVAVYDQGEDDGVVFLAMELVPGQTLRDAVEQRSPLRPAQALALIAPVVAALAAAHEAGLIHRDVKPENVLIATDGRIKVADFGLARAITSVTQHTATGMLIGTVSYLAPEIVTEGRSDARGDVYAVGVMLYELLTGHKPHTGETPIQIAYRHVHRDVPAPSEEVPGLPPYVDALVARATARDPGLRPADARVLAHQVDLVRRALADGVADDPALTADLWPRRRTGESTAPLAVPGDDTPRPLAEERPDVAARVVDEDPWEHEALEAIFGAGTGTAPVARRQPAPPPPPAPTGGGGGPRPETRPHPREPVEASTAPRRRSRRGPVLLVLALLVALAVGGGAWWYGWARWTSTPGVLGLSQADAEARLDSAGLDGAVADRRYSDIVPAGAVISSDPAPGERSLDAGSVDLVVSLGVEEHDVPRLKGSTEDQAQDAIAQAGLTFGSTRREFSETVPEGVVVLSEPRAGTTLRAGSTVDLVVSRGREPVRVGSWEGRTLDTATAMLQRRGLLVEVAEEQYSTTVAAGRVISQQPDSTTTLFRGDTVRLVVSRGPQLVTVPEGLVASGVQAATDALRAVGLEVETRESSSYIGLGYVLSVDPGSGTQVPVGSTVVLDLV